MSSINIAQDVLKRLQLWRKQLLWQQLLNCIAMAAIVFSLFRLFDLFATNDGNVYFAITIAGLVLIAFAKLLFSKQWRALTTDNFFLHLNRRFPDFEESAQLLIRDDAELGVLQQLQKQRSRNVYSDNLAKVQQWQPPARYSRVVIITLISCLLGLLAPQLRVLTSKMTAPTVVPDAQTTRSAVNAISLQSVNISITPPDYTGLLSSQTQSMDLDVLEGSLIEWQLVLDGEADAYAIELSDGEQIPLGFVNKQWQAHLTATSTDLYKLAAVNSGETTYIGDIYALTVQLDRAPDIKVLEPAVSTLEIPKSGPATFESEVLVADDFGIESVNILASVAKGSGEGVKFRDETLSFDRSSITDKGELYQRYWDLVELGMEPGDEIYFSVVANDNKQPEANTSRSTTLIVRWLEDEAVGLTADGLAIDFIPEFFKSQRQIIIDTEQLIEDHPNLEEQVFKNTSYETGQAQADLKQKYGQFLGDEFDEGSDEQFAPPTESSTHGDEHDEDHDNDDDHAEARANPAGGHAHVEPGVTINNATDMNDIVKLFGHDHGAPEVGKVNKQSPVALMKRAVNEMWSAERHLMQAEPELALPYEYEAYKYLKLARQADRIYVKRLGFEPPPVSEEKRLTGELKDIRSYQLQQSADPADLPQSRATQRLLRQLWQLLGSINDADMIKPADDELLSAMSSQYKTMSQQRPALINQAATIEKLRAAKQWRLNNCDGCVDELKQSIWNLMDDGDAHLMQPLPVYGNDDDLIRDYQRELP